MNEYDTVVIGAGISGLTAAHILRAKGEEVVILTDVKEIGGKITTFIYNNVPIEIGPRIIRESTYLSKLLAFSNIAPFETITNINKALFSNNKLVKIPDSLWEIFFLNLPIKEKILFFICSYKYLQSGNYASFKDFISSLKCPFEIVDNFKYYLETVFCSDATEIFPPLIFPKKVRLKDLFLKKSKLMVPKTNFRDFIYELAAPFTVLKEYKVTRIEYKNNRFLIDVNVANSLKKVIKSRRVVVAVPSFKAAEILRPLFDTTAILGISHSSLSVVSFLLRDEIPLQYEMVLFPDKYRTTIFYDSKINPYLKNRSFNLVSVVQCVSDFSSLDIEDKEIRIDNARKVLYSVIGKIDPIKTFDHFIRNAIVKPTNEVVRVRKLVSKFEESNKNIIIIGDWLSTSGIAKCVEYVWRKMEKWRI